MEACFGGWTCVVPRVQGLESDTKEQGSERIGYLDAGEPLGQCPSTKNPLDTTCPRSR